jgi:hypothetical protein
MSCRVTPPPRARRLVAVHVDVDIVVVVVVVSRGVRQSACLLFPSPSLFLSRDECGGWVGMGVCACLRLGSFCLKLSLVEWMDGWLVYSYHITPDLFSS